jgi:hypothetical protein
MINWPAKDPDEVLDYQLDWADDERPRLEAGETITSSAWSVVSGTVVIDDDDSVGGVTTVWLSGGEAGEACVILNRVTTSEGRTYDQSCRLRIRTR